MQWRHGYRKSQQCQKARADADLKNDRVRRWESNPTKIRFPLDFPLYLGLLAKSTSARPSPTFVLLLTCNPASITHFSMLLTECGSAEPVRDAKLRE